MNSIEGSEIELKSKKITPKFKNPRETNTLNGGSIIIYPIALDRNGDGEIIIEHSPKKALICETSLLDKGSKIAGKALWGFSSNPLKPGSISKGGEARTGRHSNQHTIISGICFLQIIIDFMQNSIETHPQDIYLK